MFLTQREVSQLNMTVQSAVIAARICCKWAAKDTRTVYIYAGGTAYGIWLYLSSPQAIAFYRQVWQAIQVARLWMMKHVDEYVASCLEPAATPEDRHLPGAGELAEPETGIPAAVETEIEQALKVCDQTIALDADILPQVVEQERWAALEMEPTTAQIAVPVDEEGAIATLEKSPPFPAFSLRTESTDPNKMTSEQLRKECSKLGIRWRNAHGKGRHMTRPEMLQQIGEAIA